MTEEKKAEVEAKKKVETKEVIKDKKVETEENGGCCGGCS